MPLNESEVVVTDASPEGSPSLVEPTVADQVAEARDAIAEQALAPSTESIAGFNLFENRDFEKRIQSIPYVNLRPVVLSVPAGLKTDLVSYARFLVACAQAAADLQKDVLEPYQGWIRTKLGNPASLASITNTLQYSSTRANRMARLNEEADAVLHPSTTTQTVQMPYGQAVQRNQDWFALADQLAQIDKLCSDSIQRDIQQRTKDVEADLTTLHARIKEDPDTYKVSVPTIKSLAEVTRLVAKEIEQFAILRMRIKELATCLTANRNKLEKIIA